MYKAISVLCRFAAVLLLPLFLGVPAGNTAKAAERPENMVGRMGDDLPDYQQPVLPERQPKQPGNPASLQEKAGQPETSSLQADEDWAGALSQAVSSRKRKEKETPAPVYANPADLRSLSGREAGKAKENGDTPQEKITGTMTAVSGRRLNRLMEWNRDSVLFEKQGVAVYLPTDFLRELNLGNEDLLSVTIQALESGFFLAVSVESEEVTVLPETLVRFPARDLAPDEAVELADEAGNRYPAAWNADMGLITAAVSHTGSYQLRKQKASDGRDALITEEPIPRKAKGEAVEEQDEKNRGRTVYFLLGAVLLMGIGAGGFLYRKWGRR